jgi:hypothetical protein
VHDEFAGGLGDGDEDAAGGEAAVFADRAGVHGAEEEAALEGAGGEFGILEAVGVEGLFERWGAGLLM